MPDTPLYDPLHWGITVIAHNVVDIVHPQTSNFVGTGVKIKAKGDSKLNGSPTILIIF